MSDSSLPCASARAQVRLLREQAQRGKDTIRSALAPRVAGAQASGAAALAPSRDTAAASAVAVTLRAASGPYSGTTFALRLAPGKQSSVAMIGRSTGKKFRDNGVSLPKDGEVSTTHARVELAPEHAAGAPAVAVVDADSTNGTSLDGVALVPGAPVALRSGATLRVGVTELQVEIAC